MYFYFRILENKGILCVNSLKMSPVNRAYMNLKSCEIFSYWTWAGLMIRLVQSNVMKLGLCKFWGKALGALRHFLAALRHEKKPELVYLRMSSLMKREALLQKDNQERLSQTPAIVFVPA